VVGERLGNWGRWGDEDERGTLNLAGPDCVRRGLAAVRDGIVVSLSLPLRARDTPTVPPRPQLIHMMTVDGGDFEAGAARGRNGFQFADDYVGLATHSGTHIDALSHVGRDGTMYNGFPTTSVRSTTGARRLGIENFGGLATRAHILDIPALLGVEILEPGTEITVAHLEQGLAASAAEIVPGDAVLLRTGWLDGELSYEAEAGLGFDAARWLAARDVSLIGADNFAVELVPSATGEMMPVHLVCLHEHGIHLLEFVDLTPLIESAVTSCLLIVAPLAVVGGVGSPVNPIAVY
jgi:kynurenine formamidase